MIFNKHKNNFTDHCKECPKNTGIEVFYDMDTRVYTHAPQIYGHYKLQIGLINDRVHFKKGKGDDALGIWWNGSASWTIGYYNDKGSKNCLGFFIQDVLCPHQIEEWNGKLFHGEGIGLRDAGDSLAVQCSIRGNVIY